MKKYYCIGIKGAGMATLACILHDLGNEVVGYDDVVEHKFTQEGLDARGIKIYHDQNHELDKDFIVTFSRAFSLDHKEIVRVKENGLMIKSYNDIIGELTEMFRTISVSGTHGKTTTTSMINHVLSKVMNTNYFIGDGSGEAKKENEVFVIESDEFNKHFLAYHPTYSVITNIELEHTECYDGLEDIINTFANFANINTKEKLVVCGDNENIRKISFNKPVIYYGFSEENDTVAKNISLTEKGSSFDVYRNGEFYGHFSLPLYGNHMILNALACIEICILEKIEKEVIEEAFQDFHNAKRRFAIENIDNTVIIDDYAHHPTEIKVTLESARQKYGDKEIIAIFKPNTYSRTKEFTKDFIDVLNMADKAYVTPIDSNREKQEDYPGITSSMIIDKLNNGEEITEDTAYKLASHKDSVLVFMSCASIAHLKENTINELEKILRKNK